MCRNCDENAEARPTPKDRRYEGEAINATRPMTSEEITGMMVAKLRERMRYHPPTPDQVKVYSRVREQFIHLGTVILSEVPDNNDRARALTCLEDLLMLTNKAIALG